MLLSPWWHSHPPFPKNYLFGNAGTCTWNAISHSTYIVSKTTRGPGQSTSPPLPLLWLLPPYSQRWLTGRVGKPSKERGGGGHAQDLVAFPNHQRGVWSADPSNPPFLPLQKQLLPSGTPEGEADLGQDRIRGSWVPLPNDQINVVLIVVHSDSQHLASNTSHLMKPFPLVPLKDTPFLPCT